MNLVRLIWNWNISFTLSSHKCHFNITIHLLKEMNYCFNSFYNVIDAPIFSCDLFTRFLWLSSFELCPHMTDHAVLSHMIWSSGDTGQRRLLTFRWIIIIIKPMMLFLRVLIQIFELCLSYCPCKIYDTSGLNYMILPQTSWLQVFQYNVMCQDSVAPIFLLY